MVCGDGAEIDFVLGDITDLKSFDWTDGDILFANSTCFDDRVRRLAPCAPFPREIPCRDPWVSGATQEAQYYSSQTRLEGIC